jgi:hypothetical protein
MHHLRDRHMRSRNDLYFHQRPASLCLREWHMVRIDSAYFVQLFVTLVIILVTQTLLATSPVCSVGYYELTKPSTTNDRVCKMCPAGNSCAGKSAAPKACGKASLFSAGGIVTNCSSVSAGYYSTPLSAAASLRTGLRCVAQLTLVMLE